MVYHLISSRLISSIYILYLFQAMCKIYYYVWNVSYTASIVILTTIAVERYINIIYPLKARHFMTRRKLIIFQIIIWLVAIIYNVPYIVFYDTVEFPFVDIEFCYFKEESRVGLKGLSVANIIVWYVIPLGVIGVLYFIIGRALLNTAVVSALRLNSFGDSKNSSIRSARTHCASRVNSASTHCPGDKLATPKDNQDSRGSQDDVVYKHDNNIVLFNARGTLTFICGVQNSSASPKELNGFINDSSARNSSQSDEQITPLSDDVYDDKLSTVSHKKPSIRYQQTHLESSRKVARARKKVIRLLTAIVITFSFCVLPHHVKVLNHYWHIYTLPHETDVYISPIAAVVLYLNSALNPILYALFSSNFRKSFKETLPCFGGKTKKPTSFRVICSN